MYISIFAESYSFFESLLFSLEISISDLQLILLQLLQLDRMLCFHQTYFNTLGLLTLECLEDVSLDLQLRMLTYGLVKLLSRLVLTLVVATEEHFQASVFEFGAPGDLFVHSTASGVEIEFQGFQVLSKGTVRDSGKVFSGWEESRVR